MRTRPAVADGHAPEGEEGLGGIPAAQVARMVELGHIAAVHGVHLERVVGDAGDVLAGIGLRVRPFMGFGLS